MQFSTQRWQEAQEYQTSHSSHWSIRQATKITKLISLFSRITSLLHQRLSLEDLIKRNQLLNQQWIESRRVRLLLEWHLTVRAKTALRNLPSNQLAYKVEIGQQLHFWLPLQVPQVNHYKMKRQEPLQSGTLLTRTSSYSIKRQMPESILQYRKIYSIGNKDSRLLKGPNRMVLYKANKVNCHLCRPQITRTIRLDS